MRDLLAWCYPRAEQHPRWHRARIHDALPRWAISIGRIAERQGRPAIYIPNPELRKLIG